MIVLGIADDFWIFLRNSSWPRQKTTITGKITDSLDAALTTIFHFSLALWQRHYFSLNWFCSSLLILEFPLPHSQTDREAVLWVVSMEAEAKRRNAVLAKLLNFWVNLNKCKPLDISANSHTEHIHCLSSSASPVLLRVWAIFVGNFFLFLSLYPNWSSDPL